MPLLRYTHTLTLLLVSAATSFGQAPNIPGALVQAAKSEVEKQGLVGTAVGVILDGKVAYTFGFGFADRDKNVPVEAEKTSFRWASCSKTATAIAAMQLVEAGKLDLDADVRTYVPEFPDKGAKITALQLLCHQGGIVHYANGKVVKTEKTYDVEHPFVSVITALDTFKESPLVNQPGEKYSYSTHGYILLSAVVERAGKEKFADQVKTRIADPLRMTSFRPDYQWENIPKNWTEGYLKRNDRIVRRGGILNEDPDVSWKLGGGGYTSTVEDFAKFGAGIINHKLVKSDTERAMMTRQKLANGADAGAYGLGFQLGRTPGGVNWVGHSGAQEKTRTMMMLDVPGKRGVVVMTNSEWGNPQLVGTKVLDALAGPVTPLKNAHAHNDYEHPRPLFDALDQGFCSVEADIYLVDGKLLVAHERKDVKPDRTLESLYLDLLRARAKANGGKVYKDGPAFHLLIDVKTGAEDTYAALDKVLTKYADLLTVVKGGKAEPKAVTVVLSGNRAKETIAKQAVRYVGIDGRPEYLDSDSPAHLVPWISASWITQFKWLGEGPFPADQKAKLKAFVEKAHARGRLLRFWATPEKEAFWKELRDCGVDLINTDKLPELRAFLLKK